MVKRLASSLAVLLFCAFVSAPSWAAKCTNLPASPYCDSENYAGCCGPNPSSVATSSVTETGVSATVTKESAAESVYACVHLDTVTPTDEQIREGLVTTCEDTGVLHDQNGTASFTSANAFTGLDASTTYEVSIIVDEGTARPIRKVVTSSSFTTDVSSGGGGGGGDVEITGGDNYFVDCDSGSDAAAGTSMAAAWLTLDKVNTDVSTAGADVYIKHGTNCAAQDLDLDWGGVNQSNTAKIDCYYDDAGTPRTCGTQVKPIIDGGIALSAFQTGTVDYRTSAYTGAPLSGSSDALIAITSDHTEVRYLQVERSRAGGVLVQGDNTAGSLQYFKIDQVDINNTGTYIMLFENGVRYGVVSNNTSTLTGACEQQRYQSGQSLTEICNWAGWPAGITIVRSANAEVLVYNNEVGKTFTECYNAYSGTSHVIFHGNTCAQSFSNGYYSDFADHIVYEHNISIGSKDNQGYSQAVSTFGGSVTVAGEDVVQVWYDGVEDQTIRNNVLVDSGYCFDAGMEPAAQADGDQVGFMFVGNTCIGSRTADIKLWEANSVYSEAVVKTNLFQTSDATEAQCTANTSGIEDFNYNVWDTDPADAQCDGANDTYGDASLPHSYADYNTNYTADNLPAFSDFELTSASIGNNDGDPSLETLARLTGADYGYALDELMLLETWITTEANWEKALFYCADEVARNATAPRNGAVCTDQ